MTGERTLPVNRATAWHALNDMTSLKDAIPGCESIAANANGGFDVSVQASIGPVKARFKGTMSLTDVEPPHRYTLRFESQGGPAGFARGEARVTLEDDGGPATTLRYAVTAQVGGRLAQVGSRLIDAAAAAMADQFFAGFARGLSAAAASAPPPTAAPAATTGAGLWTLLLKFLGQLFRK